MFNTIIKKIKKRFGMSRLHDYIRYNAAKIHYADYMQTFYFIKKLYRETELLMYPIEAFYLYYVVKNLAKIPGDIAEIGVYKGGSAKIICEACDNKTVYLFDTFNGIPNVMNQNDCQEVYTGMHTASIDVCKKLLAQYKNVKIHSGIFPFPCAEIADRSFSFVHLDVDTYQSTLEGIRFFYPKLASAGIILCHNYLDNCGVHKAMHDFVTDKTETVLPYIGTFGMIVKIGR